MRVSCSHVAAWLQVRSNGKAIKVCLDCHQAYSPPTDYTKYKYIDKDSKDRGDMMGGQKVVNHKDLTKCCWMGYLTVMYDADKLGRFQVRNIEKHNDYALWMDVSEKADCHLLDECLASLRVNHRLLSPLPMFDKLRWRYEVFHTVEDLNPFKSFWLTIRNMIGGFMKKVKYVEKIK